MFVIESSSLCLLVMKTGWGAIELTSVECGLLCNVQFVTNEY